ncbi:MAG: ABC transporter ATP-binding protein, partial [Coprobacillus sp.]
MKLVWTYLKKYKKYLFINLICAFGFILIEIGIPTLLAKGINANFKNGDVNFILGLGLEMWVFSIIGFIMLIFLAYSTERITSLIVRDVRNDLFAHIQTFSRDQYEEFGISRFITNTGTDAYMIMQFMTLILRTGIIAPFMIATSFFMIMRENFQLAFITIGAVPLLLLGVFLINRVTHPLSQKLQKGLDGINRNMRESLTGLRVVRAFNNEDLQEKRFKKVNDNYARLSKLMFQKVAFISPIFTVIFCGVMVAVVSIGSYEINQGMLQVGTLAAFIEYVFHALFSFLMLASVLIMYPRFSVSVERIKEVLDTKAEIDPNRENGIVETDTQGYIEFDNVSFCYGDACEEYVLSNISFTAKPGETVAFIGSTGSGKSTLIKLLPRFFDVSQGSINIDGINIKDYNIDALRRKIGYVPQKATLFSGTFRENLLFGNREASEEDLHHSIEIAQAKDFIESKENGLDEIISEGGTNLSGGQKQRLCIARALTRKAPIYI